jgi:adenine-specific DNA methylase
MSNRRLIEDSLPLGEISEYSAAEKSIRHGHISTLHLWWARRPLAAARAATMAALLPAPRNEDERRLFHKLITDNLDWELSKEPQKQADHLRAILKEHGVVAAPKTLDPFSGGGALPLEAERLGAEAFATDLNPVAHLVELATLYYPQRFAHLRSERTNEDKLLGRSRLVAEIERWSKVVQERATADLEKYYRLDNKDEPLFYIWARTVRCQNPACRAEIPLVGSFILQKKSDYVAALIPRVSAKRKEVDFDIVENPDEKHDLAAGIVTRANAVCPCCNETTSSKDIKARGMAGELGHRLLAVAVREGTRGKRYRVPTASEARRAKDVPTPEAFGDIPAVPHEPLPPNDTRAFFVTLYGLRTWGSIYNPRQALAMATFARHVRALAKEIKESNKDLGEEADEFSRAVTTYLGLCVSKLSDFSSSITILNPHDSPRPKNTFRMQAIQMTWDYLEVNPISDGAGSWQKITSDIDTTLERLTFQGHARVQRASADQLPFDAGAFDAIITDPPYYDAVPYSDLSDYFYVWLRRAIGELHPEVLATELTPKRSEMVQNPAHNKSAGFFESAMSRAFGEMHRTLKDEGIMVLVFAHKSTSAWETLLKALLDNNLVVTASWPIETEKPGRTRAIGSAALASSVFIVCRKRSAHDEGFLDDVEPDMRARLHERLDYFWSQGIRGADFFMSAIGPAVEVFGRHKRVLKLSGEEVTIAELLDKVRGIVADYALQRIVHGEAAGNVDEASRFYVIWRWAYGTSDVESGEAIHMAQSMGCEFSELVADSGVLGKSGDKVSLKGPVDRKKTKGLGEPAATGTLAPLIDVLHRAANLWAAGERQELADFLATALPPGGVDRMQRLAQSIVDVLPPGDKERALYENFLVGARSLPQPTKKDEAAVKQQKLF